MNIKSQVPNSNYTTRKEGGLPVLLQEDSTCGGRPKSIDNVYRIIIVIIVIKKEIKGDVKNGP